MKKIAVVPTLLTLGNGICGFVALTFASKIGLFGHGTPEATALDEWHFVWAGWFILFAMLFDMLDGYVARLSRTASAFGGELDSLCDAISFGVAPAFLVLKLGPGWEPSRFLHQLLAGIAALYLACTVLRLARFNVDNTPDPSGHKRFRGLPSPGAAGCIAALAILRGDFVNKLVLWNLNVDTDLARAATVRLVEIVSPVGALLVALLMVSNVPYPHVTGKVFAGKRHIGHLIQLLLAVFIISMIRELAPVVIFWVYALAFPIRALFVHGTRRGRIERAGPAPPDPARADAAVNLKHAHGRQAVGFRDTGLTPRPVGRGRVLQTRANGSEPFLATMMFTGLVETMGTVRAAEPDGDGTRLWIADATVARELPLGASVALNGVCLTVVARDGDAFAFQVGPETLRRTNLGALRPGMRVNLERALRVGDRLGGHIVQGHVDGLGTVERRERQGEWEVVWFRCPPELARYLVPKGSVAVDGVSLTLVDAVADGFSVALIPHTLAATTLGHKQPPATVNLEVDLFAKYVFRCLEQITLPRP